MPSLNSLKKLVNDKYSLVAILRRYEPEENYQLNQRCYCPFHENVNTPSAALYLNEDKESLFCFAENKLYTAYDALELLLKQDPLALGKALWDKMDAEEKANWLSINGEDFSSEFDLKEEPKVSRELEIKKELYKRGEVSLEEVVKCYIDNHKTNK